MEYNFNIGDFVKLNIDKQQYDESLYFYEKVQDFEGIIVEITKYLTGVIAIAEQKDGTRKCIPINYLERVDGEKFDTLYMRLKVGQKVKAQIMVGDEIVRQFEGVIKVIIPHVNYNKFFFEDSFCTQAIIESKNGTKYFCALMHLYPID